MYLLQKPDTRINPETTKNASTLIEMDHIIKPEKILNKEKVISPSQLFLLKVYKLLPTGEGCERIDMSDT